MTITMWLCLNPFQPKTHKDSGEQNRCCQRKKINFQRISISHTFGFPSHYVLDFHLTFFWNSISPSFFEQIFIYLTFLWISISFSFRFLFYLLCFNGFPYFFQQISTSPSFSISHQPWVPDFPGSGVTRRRIHLFTIVTSTQSSEINGKPRLGDSMLT